MTDGRPHRNPELYTCTSSRTMAISTWNPISQTEYMQKVTLPSSISQSAPFPVSPKWHHILESWVWSWIPPFLSSLSSQLLRSNNSTFEFTQRLIIFSPSPLPLPDYRQPSFPTQMTAETSWQDFQPRICTPFSPYPQSLLRCLRKSSKMKILFQAPA